MYKGKKRYLFIIVLPLWYKYLLNKGFPLLGYPAIVNTCEWSAVVMIKVSDSDVMAKALVTAFSNAIVSVSAFLADES